jgi:hypothetical protein
VARGQGRESIVAMWRTYSFKSIADEEPRGDFKRGLWIHEVLGEVVK